MVCNLRSPKASKQLQHTQPAVKCNPEKVQNAREKGLGNGRFYMSQHLEMPCCLMPTIIGLVRGTKYPMPTISVLLHNTAQIACALKL